MKAFILLTHGDTAIAKGIQVSSWIYEDFGKHTKSDIMYNHAVIVFRWLWIWWYQEALVDGISKYKPFGSSSYYKEGNFVVKTIKQDLNKDEYANSVNWGISKIGTKYDFLGIVSWIGKIATNSWLGKKGADAEKRLYCSEFALLWFNKGREIFTNTWEQSPMNIYDNEKDTIFIDNKVFYDFINNKIQP